MFGMQPKSNFDNEPVISAVTDDETIITTTSTPTKTTVGKLSDRSSNAFKQTPRKTNSSIGLGQFKTNLDKCKIIQKRNMPATAMSNAAQEQFNIVSARQIKGIKNRLEPIANDTLSTSLCNNEHDTILTAAAATTADTIRTSTFDYKQQQLSKQHQQYQQQLQQQQSQQSHVATPFLSNDVSKNKNRNASTCTTQHVALANAVAPVSLATASNKKRNNINHIENNNCNITATSISTNIADIDTASSSSSASISNAVKHVNFDLPTTIEEDENDNESDNCTNNNEKDVNNALAKFEKEKPQQHQQKQRDKQQNQKLNNLDVCKNKQTRHQSTHYKNIIFNGTYPIDMPLQSRFKLLPPDYDPEANVNASQVKYECDMLHEFGVGAPDGESSDDGDDDDDDDDYNNLEGGVDSDFDIEEYMRESMTNYHPPSEETKNNTNTGGFLQNLGILKRNTKSSSKPVPAPMRSSTITQTTSHHAVWSMQELIANPAIPLNYQKMCHEVEQSLSNFEKYLDSKSYVRHEHNTKHSNAVRTYDIDGPIVETLDSDKEEKKKL